MPDKELSSLDLRAFLRSCHSFLQEDMTLDSWSAFQKFLLISGSAGFGLYVRQLKKLSPPQKLAIVDGFSSGQVESKIWLLETLRHVLPAAPLDTHILGSWFGLLPRMAAWLDDEFFAQVSCYDLDPQWEKAATFLNEPESYRESWKFLTRDMNHLDYAQILGPRSLVINTSCEHLRDFRSWFRLLPPGSLVALQGNNFVEPEEHQTVWRHLEAFSVDTPLAVELFSGQLDLPKYSRFMRIGVIG